MANTSSPLSAVSAGYVEDLYDRFRTRPEELDESWRCLFGVLDLVGDATGTDLAAGLAKRGADARQAALAEALRRWGHLGARLNPLAAPAPLPEAEAFAAHLPPDAAAPALLRALYCGSLAIETAHIDDPARRNWLIEHFEAASLAPPPADEVALLGDLTRRRRPITSICCGARSARRTAAR